MHTRTALKKVENIVILISEMIIESVNWAT